MMMPVGPWPEGGAQRAFTFTSINSVPRLTVMCIVSPRWRRMS